MNFLQRMPQSGRIALVLSLFAAAVGGWYFGFVRPSQLQAAELNAPVVTQPIPNAANTARPLEVLPLPFLVTEAAERPAGEQGETETVAAVAPGRPRVTVPPNPFVPLITETPTPGNPAVASATPPFSRPSVAASRPIPTQTGRIQVRQPVAPLPTASLPAARPTISPRNVEARLAPTGRGESLPTAAGLGGSALPIRLAPLDRELAGGSAQASRANAALDPNVDANVNLDFARAELNVRVAQALEPRTAAARPTDSVQQSSLATFVREQGIKLSSVVLGPTSIAIFQTKEGFVVLPVGRTLPGSDVLLRSLNTNEAQLVQGAESLNLPVENP